MRSNVLIPPLCGLVLLTTAGCPESADDGDDATSGTPGADPLVGTWNLDESDGYDYPYTYTDEDGCMITYSSEITFGADLRGVLLEHEEYGAGCAPDSEEYPSPEYEAVPAGANGYDMAVYLPPPANVHLSYSCTLSGSTLTCVDDEDGSTMKFSRA